MLHGRPYQAVFSDLGSKKYTTGIPKTIEEKAVDRAYSFTKLPNNAVKRRGGFLHHPNYSTLYVGEGTQFWKSTDMGATWTALHDFGTTVRFMEISHKNPNVIYADVEGDGLYKSGNGGYTWSLKTNPTSNFKGRYHIVISPYNEDFIYVCRQKNNQSNHSSIYKSVDGGSTWTNWSDGLPTNIYPKMLAIQPTDANVDLVYLSTTPPVSSGQLPKVYYRKNDGAMQWDDYSNNYPASSAPIAMLPFYKDSKLRIAGNFGVWESPLAEENATPPYITPWLEKQEHQCYDKIYLEDHSMIDHRDVTSWKWTISPEPLSISNANSRNPIIIVGEEGDYTVTLEVVKNGVTYSKHL